jgi:hypothetical protein
MEILLVLGFFTFLVVEIFELNDDIILVGNETTGGESILVTAALSERKTVSRLL